PKLAVTALVGALLKEERDLYKNEDILRLFYETRNIKIKGVRVNKLTDNILVETPDVPSGLAKNESKKLVEELDKSISVKAGVPDEKKAFKKDLLKTSNKIDFSKEKIRNLKNLVINKFSNNLIGMAERSKAIKAIERSAKNIYLKLGECNQIVDEELVKQWRKYGISRVELADPDHWDPEQTINDLTIHLTLQKDPYKTISEARMGIYSRYNAGQPRTKASVDSFFKGLFDKCFLSEVGRFKLNKKFQFVYERYMENGKIKELLEVLPDIKSDSRKLQPEDLIYYIDYIIQLNNGNNDHIIIDPAAPEKRKYRFGESPRFSLIKNDDPGYTGEQMSAYYVDDVDDLENRRVRTVGEQLHKEFERGINRMKKRIIDKKKLLSVDDFIKEPEKRNELLKLLNPNIVNAVINSFFGTGQLSQFMSQTNPLDALTHKRRLSALGPGGLTRKTAKGGVRDVHPTHYGRICPIETPEGSNIGLIYSLALYANINEMGFIETPYRKINNKKVTKKIEYLDAREEKIYIIAQAIALDGDKLPDSKLIAYKSGEFDYYSPEEIDYMDVSPQQIVSVSAALIPFLEHDDANRALMGSNMQRQALPLEITEPPIVSTGVEGKAAKNSGVMVEAARSGKVIYADASKIIIDHKYDSRKSGQVKPGDVDVYLLIKYKRGNQKTNFNQTPIVSEGDIVKKGDVIADGPGTARGEMALGRNLKVAFMSWEGYNYEDAVVISERLVKEDVFTSVHIHEEEIEAREMKMGNEDITRDIPNVSEQRLRDLDENGIIRVGASVQPRDILVGKVTPKGDQTYTPELRLLKTIFGKKAEEVKDNSLRVPPGVKGKVIRVEVFDRKESLNKAQRNKKIKELNKKYDNRIADIRSEASSTVGKLVHRQKSGGLSKKDYEAEKERLNIIKKVREDEVNTQRAREVEAIEANYGDELPVMVSKKVKVYIASSRKITVGDKIAGRHGNKGIISRILPVEDMPYTKDGEPVDILLNPLSVPSRMNVGQILETHIGWAAKEQNIRIITPVFAGVPEGEIKKLLKKNKLPESGTTELFDGRTGESLGTNITLGYMYTLKLEHMAEDKVHARSTGPYSLITRQPLGGKALFGGQRFGEMEVWAMEGHGAAYLLQEFLTYKSDDVEGRNRVHKAILNGEEIEAPGVPESFKVLVNELQGLGFKVVLE
ncbi:MAG: DNA-directed RNA polymerase subunit beta, partial [Elusimicrobiota bacterium]|nr:DNA-directed RNA polymerase subunit beta [Elusimicrobiota bacterium]